MRHPWMNRLGSVGVVFALVAVVIVSGAQGGASVPTASVTLYASTGAWLLAQEGGSPLGGPARAEPEEDDDYATTMQDRPIAHLRRLTNEEIQRIRYKELRSLRLLTSDRPDRVTVKISRSTVDDFLLEMEGHPDFRGESTRREFRKLTPAQKLHFIARYKGDQFIDKVEIQSDPEVFLEFRKNVMPLVLRGCATTGCHSPNYRDEVRFGLFRDAKRLPATTYANFILLNELSVDQQPVINRAQPENSLLLTYMLPDKEVRPGLRHPPVSGMRPIFQSRGAPGYRRIEQWIASLRQPAPDYGVTFFGSDGASAGERGEEEAADDDWP